jgi:hypothetical protein
MKRYWPLAVILTGILLPLEALSRVSARAGQLLRWAFDAGISRIVMHSALFAGLMLCALGVLGGRLDRRRVLTMLALLVCAALGQETFQAINRGDLVVGDTLFDLSVDIVSGLAGLALAILRFCTYEKPCYNLTQLSGEVSATKEGASHAPATRKLSQPPGT